MNKITGIPFLAHFHHCALANNRLGSKIKCVIKYKVKLECSLMLIEDIKELGCKGSEEDTNKY